jgi:subtilisin family serine protease
MNRCPYWFGLVAALLVSACQSTRWAAPAGAEAADLILVTVPNDRAVALGRAGSTARGYDGGASYGAGSDARQALQEIAKDYALRKVDAWPIQPLGVHCMVFKVPAAAQRDAIVAKLSRDPRVQLVEPMQDFQTQSAPYNDPYVGLQSGFIEIKAAEAQRYSLGTGVRVAVIDTGLDLNHPDLKHQIAVSANFVDDDTKLFYRDRHGTEIAGVIAAVANNHMGIVGIAPGVQIVALKACWQMYVRGDGARCNSFTLARALTAALERRVSVVNLSLAGPYDSLLAQLVEAGERRGIIFVGAVPPDGDVAGFPARVSGVIRVAASDAQHAGDSTLQAPGNEILTLEPGGGYDFVSGSSLATAHVTGAVALLLSRGAQGGEPEIYGLLRSTSVEIKAHGGERRSIDVCAALKKLSGDASCQHSTEQGYAGVSAIQYTSGDAR